MNDVTDQDTDISIDELSVLKQRAKLMGITYSNNISVEKLREKISAKLNDAPEVLESPEINALDPEAPAGKKESLTERLQREQLKLIRVRITNMDPKKKDLPGEVFTIANRYLGTVRKYVPYGEHSEGGYHLPWCIYQELDSRKFLNIRTAPGRNGQIQTTTGWAKEFSFEVLPPLTKEELARLATAQAAAGVFGDE